MNPGRRLECRLRVEMDGHERSFPLGDEPAVLGRGPDCDIVLPHESVSRQHARFRREGGGFSITDLDSKNGTRVNTFRVREQVLRDGDRIDVGTIRMYVEIKERDDDRASKARVVFEDEPLPSMHTEILDMRGLDQLLQSKEIVDPSGVDLFDTGIHSQVRRARAESQPDSGEPFALLRLVGEAAEALLQCTTLAETLERILGLVFDKLPVERGVICLHDTEADSTEPMVMQTRDGIPDKPIGISSNIARDAIQQKRALLVRDTMLDERFGGAESVIMMQIHSAMCAPLYREGNVSGFIYVDRQSDTQPFEMAHLQALSTLALLAAVAVEQAALRDDIRREQEQRARLARYSSPAVVERILQQEGPATSRMVSDERDVSVLFADLTGYTSMAESLHAGEVIRLLNQIFERLTTVIFELDGTLDKFRGDGLMAFFGAPLPMADHAARAVEAALRMQESLSHFNSGIAHGPKIRMRIGINSGPVVVGDIGSPQRKDYTVIGDVVNTASRLESAVAKPGQIVIGSATYERLGETFECEALAEVHLKGKRKAVSPYLVRGHASHIDETRAL